MRRRLFVVAAGQTFGKFLRRERERKGWTIRYLADLIHISSDKSITAWEIDRQRPQAQNLADLGRVFQWDFNRVMTYLGAPQIKGIDRIATGLARRPLLQHLFEAARELDDEPLSVLVTTAAVMAERKKGVDRKSIGSNVEDAE